MTRKKRHILLAAWLVCLSMPAMAIGMDDATGIGNMASPPAIEHSVLENVYGSAWIARPPLNESALQDPVLPEAENPSYEFVRHYIPVEVNGHVREHLKHFQGRGRGSLSLWLERSEAYMPMVKRILAEEGLPEDLAYLALIESGFSPNARSRAGAVGIWQFMPWTGKDNGLKTDWWIDERKDPELSTRAAARHLKALYERFGSWYLAAAGYNAGEGRIARAVSRSGSTDFWEISASKSLLKRETRDYIPRYLAAMMIAKNPRKYGFTEPGRDNALRYDSVTVSEPTDLGAIARAADASVDEIKKLNPALLRRFTPPGRKAFEIRIPQGRADGFNARLADLSTDERLRFHTHTVKKGENLFSIARRYDTPAQTIANLNDIKSSRNVRVGVALVIPIK